MPRLDGKVAVVTGAGRGIGREHALALARAGAKIVVNDLGASLAGEGADEGPAHDVVREIEALGGEAIADGENVADFAGAKRLIDGAVAAFGRLDILVNNAGILRDRMLVNMEEHEWDAVIEVHLKGHFAPTRHAAAHWRERSKAGEQVAGRVINTSSPSGVFGNVGQTELRRRESRDRRLHADRCAGAATVRSDRERDRTECANAHDRGCVRRDPTSRRRFRRGRPGEQLAHRRRALRGRGAEHHRPGVLHLRRRGQHAQRLAGRGIVRK